VKNPHCSVWSTATNGDVPLSFLILTDLLYESGSPDIQLQRLSVALQPVGKLLNGIGHNVRTQQQQNTPWEMVYKPANMTGTASTEARYALFIQFYWN
jgi:hypothetical protein